MNTLTGLVFVAAVAYAAAQSCGGNLQGPNGTFTSPNWPSKYPNSVACQWTIKVASGNTITLDFVDFELERASPVYGCAGRDFVVIVDGDDSYGPHCGTDAPAQLKSKTNEVVITFRSDDSLNYRGFLATYVETENGPTTTPAPPTTAGPTTKYPPTINCGEEVSGDSGSVTSPKYPSNYPDNADCSYFIELEANTTGQITLNFQDMEIEDTADCKADSLTVHDGVNGYAPVVATLCGKKAAPITTTGRAVYMRFRSNAANNFRGFNISWERSTCEDAGGFCGASCDNGEIEGTESCNATLKCCKKEPVVPKEECGKRFLSDEDLPYIVGGREAKPNSWPWQVSLQRGTFHYCGAVLLSDTWVVTAAHCVHDEILVTVVLGEHDRNVPSGDEVRIVASEIIVHEDFINSSPWPNDIALLKLSEPVKLGPKYYPACFPKEVDQDFGLEDNCYISGWGDTKGTGDRTLLNELQIAPLPNEVCRLSWGATRILDTNICIGDGTAGSCQGDSGGPLVCKKDEKWVLAGVTSWGIRGCRTAGYPSVYTRVSKFLPWVREKIGASNLCA